MKTFIIEEQEKNRILNMHKEATEKHYLNNLSESKDSKGNINEQLTLLNVPSLGIMMGSSPGNEQQILLKGVDPKTKITSVLKYNVEGQYEGIGFDVNLRNFKRNADGSLYVEAQPDNWFVKTAVSALIPNKDLTKDGWIMNKIPKAKIDNAIAALKQNKGTTANLDAGHGVMIKLSLDS
jgi:hypothetical protein